jgi:hypothetical protein
VATGGAGTTGQGGGEAMGGAAGAGATSGAGGQGGGSDAGPRAPDATPGGDDPTAAVLRCGTELVCGLASDPVCCVVYAWGAGTTTYGCLADGASTGSCNSAIRTCDDVSDCPEGQSCCAEWRTGSLLGQRYADFACAESCEASEALIECRGRAACPDAEVCCGALRDSGTQYYSLTCAESCEDDVICDSSEDCPDPATQTCVQSAILPPGWGHCVDI